MNRLLLAAAAVLALASPAAAQISSSTTALAANQVIKAGPGGLWSFQVSAIGLVGAAWYVMIFDATAAPADGAVTPRKCYVVASGTPGLSINFDAPVVFGTGITISVSTTGCFTKTASTSAFISGDFQ